jgi:hypothetical protein
LPNTSLPVGAIAGADASGNGAASYNVPIAIPKGANGMQPSISINYSSAQKNGLLGWGTNLAVESSITRGNKNIYFDGSISPMKGDNSDAFYLDGQRLLLVSEVVTGGQYYALFKTEVLSQVKIEAFGNTSNEINYWKITSADAGVSEFGNTIDSKIQLGNIIYAWRINKVIDVFTNYMVYEYINTNDDFRISKIKYTGNITSNVLPTNEINFTYH